MSCGMDDQTRLAQDDRLAVLSAAHGLISPVLLVLREIACQQYRVVWQRGAAPAQRENDALTGILGDRDAIAVNNGLLVNVGGRGARHMAGYPHAEGLAILCDT